MHSLKQMNEIRDCYVEMPIYIFVVKGKNYILMQKFQL